MICQLCWAPIREGQLFIHVMRADANGGEAPLRDGETTLAVHIGGCPTMSAHDYPRDRSSEILAGLSDDHLHR